ncbi:hypothetical protein DC366_09845 [Pelagivirga sediminicola]|uniref:2-dehydro-3-deoxygalactonokinase n=1 Tax=Pelagivirga sediminicola TaxID=2170575 RepID=A0A2T7G6C7_9RHOB|nr:2-dehydro-3-deoxygalactonokinase [Pelagivirga sediminicola]PVA09968.1 hypothetical protein DC366_09845 [Pelagivirga sediminicola]
MTAPWGVLSDERRVTLHQLLAGAATNRAFSSLAEAREECGIAPSRLIRLDEASQSPPPAATLGHSGGVLGALRQMSPAAHLPSRARILIAGVMADQPDWEGIALLPDGAAGGDGITHWVHVSAREIVSFQGAATGRIAAALGARLDAAIDEAALNDTLSRPERLAAQIYAADLSGAEAALAGHLLGAELASMRPYWLGQSVRIVGPDAAYGAALRQQGVMTDATPLAQAWAAGLAALGAAAGLTG